MTPEEIEQRCKDSCDMLHRKIFNGIKTGKLMKLVTENSDYNLNNMLIRSIELEEYEATQIIKNEINKRTNGKRG